MQATPRHRIHRGDIRRKERKMEETEGNEASNSKTFQKASPCQNLWYKLVQSETIARKDSYLICGRNFQLGATFLPQFLPQVKSHILAVFGEFWQNMASQYLKIVPVVQTFKIF